MNGGGCGLWPIEHNTKKKRLEVEPAIPGKFSFLGLVQPQRARSTSSADLVRMSRLAGLGRCCPGPIDHHVSLCHGHRGAPRSRRPVPAHVPLGVCPLCPRGGLLSVRPNSSPDCARCPQESCYTVPCHPWDVGVGSQPHLLAELPSEER